MAMKKPANPKRPAVRAAVKKVEKGLTTKKNRVIKQGAGRLNALGGVEMLSSTSNQTKKLTKRSNQSAVAKGKQPQERYIEKSRKR